jgi:integrase
MHRTYQNRHGTFYVRLVVPKALLPYTSSPKVVQSLRTKDRKQAYLRSLQINLAFERWIQDMTNKLRLNNRDLTINLPSGVKIDFDMTVPEDRAAYDNAVEQIGVFKQPLTIAKVTGSDDHASGARYRLTDLFTSYKIAKEKTFADATQAAYFPRIEKFITYYQAKGVIFIDEIRKPHAGDYREEIIKVQDSPLTVDNYTKTLKNYFDFAISAGKYPFDNPFANLHLVKKSERAKHTDSWLPYSRDEVQKLFVEEFEDYCTRFDKPDLFFAPIIGLTMGMRLDEIAQLNVSDIYEENGVWLIDINDYGEDKEVKTQAGVRKLPLPTAMLMTNFLDYHSIVKNKYGPTSLLFPWLINTASNGYGKNIGYNWTQYKKKHIIVDQPRKNFHSLRKTIGASMVDIELDMPVRKRILGHSMNGDITHEIYSKEFPLEYLRACLGKIQWNIDFSRFQFKFRNEHALDAWVRAKDIKVRRKALAK